MTQREKFLVPMAIVYWDEVHRKNLLLVAQSSSVENLVALDLLRHGYKVGMQPALCDAPREQFRRQVETVVLEAAVALVPPASRCRSLLVSTLQVSMQ